MQTSHFDQLQPLCPRCNAHGNSVRLTVKQVDLQIREHIVSATLQCGSPTCGAHYPVIDGVPILIHPLADFLREHWETINSRLDLPATHDALIGEASGMGSRFNQRRHYLSSYVPSHYGDPDADNDRKRVSESTLASIVEQTIALAAPPASLPHITVVSCSELISIFRCYALRNSY